MRPDGRHHAHRNDHVDARNRHQTCDVFICQRRLGDVPFDDLQGNGQTVVFGDMAFHRDAFIIR